MQEVEILVSLVSISTVVLLGLFSFFVRRQSERFRELDEALEEATHSSAARIDRIDHLATSNGNLAVSNEKLHDGLQRSSEHLAEVALAVRHISENIASIKHDLDVSRHDLKKLSLKLEHIQLVSEFVRERETTS